MGRQKKIISNSSLFLLKKEKLWRQSCSRESYRRFSARRRLQPAVRRPWRYHLPPLLLETSQRIRCGYLSTTAGPIAEIIFISIDQGQSRPAKAKGAACRPRLQGGRRPAAGQSKRQHGHQEAVQGGRCGRRYASVRLGARARQGGRPSRQARRCSMQGAGPPPGAAPGPGGRGCGPCLHFLGSQNLSATHHTSSH